MRVRLNGVEVELARPATVGDLLGDQETRGVAVALNGVVVPRHRHGSQPVADGDEIEIVRAVQGG